MATLFTTTKPVTLNTTPPSVADKAFIGVFFQPVVSADGKVESTVRFSKQTGIVDESGAFQPKGGGVRYLGFSAPGLAKFRAEHPSLDRLFTDLETQLTQLAPELEAEGL